MIELLGRVDEFEATAKELGFEWLTSEYDETSGDDAQDDEEDADDRKGVGATFLYLTMPSVRGLETLLSRWRAFKANKEPSGDDRLWWALFGFLQDIRVWSAKDRVDPSIARYVELMLSGNPDRPVVMEVDLWYRSEAERRDRAVETLHELLQEVGGEMLDFCSIPEIKYEAALIRVPASIAQRLALRDGKLANADEIMTIRPQSLYESEAANGSSPKMPAVQSWHPSGTSPVAAILDGYPVQGHVTLNARIAVKEVDVAAASVPVTARRHGTAMASLVVHGDLHAPQQPLNDPVVVVPVLAATPDGLSETTPPGKLPIGIIYRAVTALVAGLDEDPASHPDVVLINHSICDRNAPFVRRPTPWAVLLDYLSHQHRLLFVVSAGNIDSAFPLEPYADKKSFDSAPVAEREARILLAIEQAKGLRSILSPAESINGLTVGALHADGGAAVPVGTIDPYPNAPMTNICSALGFGVRRGIKPDVVEFGGRQTVIVSQEPENVAIRGFQSAHMGQMVAAPDPYGGDLQRVTLTTGTSNAAALTTRAGIVIAQAVRDIYAAERINWLTLKTRAVILKALLVHGARWGVAGKLLEEVYPPADPKKYHRRRETITKFLGYGRPQPELVISGDQSRITLLGADTIKHDQLHEYRIPLPSAMLSTRDVRRVIVTLAWSAPVSVTMDTYRGVALKIVDAQGKKNFWTGVSPTLQPNARSTERGTLTHLVFEGKKKVEMLADGKGLFVGVQAFANRSQFLEAEVPYAVAITLEMGQSQRSSNLYTEVRNKIQERANVRAQAQAQAKARSGAKT
ncbi:S8 family peptidase [Paraburkholderia hospita]|uniref:S8 family peptidase n=1 Tax=Paraburkholderia hospita TaxID=169430 RepID=UPI0009D06D7D|nr:S8 family peptidase [Paraburkholderia hospita]SKC53362.1 Subtilase family protein [Paraburkholderia hospita]